MIFLIIVYLFTLFFDSSFSISINNTEEADALVEFITEIGCFRAHARCPFSFFKNATVDCPVDKNQTLHCSAETGSVQALKIQGGSSIDGTISTIVGKLTGLTDLQLSGSFLFGGTIPSELGLLTELRHLFLFITQISGDLPDLSSLTKLETLVLFGNKLDGTISKLPTTSLTDLDLSGNALTGALDPFPGKVEKCELYDVGSNEQNCFTQCETPCNCDDAPCDSVTSLASSTSTSTATSTSTTASATTTIITTTTPETTAPSTKLSTLSSSSSLLSTSTITTKTTTAGNSVSPSLTSDSNIGDTTLSSIISTTVEQKMEKTTIKSDGNVLVDVESLIWLWVVLGVVICIFCCVLLVIYVKFWRGGEGFTMRSEPVEDELYGNTPQSSRGSGATNSTMPSLAPPESQYASFDPSLMQNSNRSDSEYQQLKLTDDVGGPGGEGNYGVAPPLDQGDPHLREASDVYGPSPITGTQSSHSQSPRYTNLEL